LSENIQRGDSKAVLEETTPYNFILRPIRLALRRVTISARRLMMRTQELINRDQRFRMVFRSAEVMLAFPGVISRVVGNVMSYFFWRQTGDNVSLHQAQQRAENEKNDQDNFSLNPLVASASRSQGQSN
jgi:hypothetical protein